MKVLVIGQGGREHALVHAFHKSPSVSEVHVIPGSDGMRREALCHDLNWKDTDSIVNFCIRTEISYVFIGPEDPLVQGLSDQLRERGILVVGPSQDAAQLEGSKVFSKEFMKEAKLPTARFEIVQDVAGTLAKAPLFTPPYVLKADGLAAGKGVFICHDLQELETAARDLFEKNILGSAGAKALLEQFQPGWELSFLIVTNGREFQTLPLSQDHKRLLDNDHGPNTGGMGTIAPLAIENSLRIRIEAEIIQPTLDLMTKKNMLYRGVLYFGLMITPEGPSVLEFNCRFGDPETQVILPLIENDLGVFFKEVSLGKLPPLKCKSLSTACVVLAAPGYPMNPDKGIKILGSFDEVTALHYVLHAGTKKDPDGNWITNGGRVLNAIGVGKTLEEALKNAYEIAGKINWAGIQIRKDIGSKVLKKTIES